VRHSRPVTVPLNHYLPFWSLSLHTHYIILSDCKNNNNSFDELQILVREIILRLPWTAALYIWPRDIRMNIPPSNTGRLTTASSDQQQQRKELRVMKIDRWAVCGCVTCRWTGAADWRMAEGDHRSTGENQKVGGNLRQRAYSQEGLNDAEYWSSQPSPTHYLVA